MMAYTDAFPEEAGVYVPACLMHNATEFTNVADRLLDGRCMIFTSNRCLGLAPSTVKLGDVVAFLTNSKVPLSSRPGAEGRYKVVGDAYIHGLIRGELEREGPLERRQFILE